MTSTIQTLNEQIERNVLERAEELEAKDLRISELVNENLMLRMKTKMMKNRRMKKRIRKNPNLNLLNFKKFYLTET